MKIKQLISIAFIMLSGAAYAGCDMCSMYLGLNPNYTKNTIGLRYRYSLYQDQGMHQHGGSGTHVHPTDGSVYNREFNTVELWGMFYPTQKLQVITFVPFMTNVIRHLGRREEVISGLGDVSLMARYQIFQTSSDSTRFRQRLFAGLGVKLPTGEYRSLYNDGMLDPHIQPGTGSTDISFSVGYLLKFGLWGFNNEVNYKLNSQNSNAYRFADRFSNTSTVFYTIEMKEVVLMPNAGAYIETSAYDKDHGTEMVATNGTILNATAGLDLYRKRYSLTMNYHLPVMVRLNDPTGDHRSRLQVGLNYSF